MLEAIRLPSFLAVPLGVQNCMQPVVFASHGLCEKKGFLNAVQVTRLPPHLENILFVIGVAVQIWVRQQGMTSDWCQLPEITREDHVDAAEWSSSTAFGVRMAATCSSQVSIQQALQVGRQGADFVTSC